MASRVSLQLPKSQPLKRNTPRVTRDNLSITSIAKEPTTETDSGYVQAGRIQVSLQLPKSQPLKPSVVICCLASTGGITSIAKEPTTETKKDLSVYWELSRITSIAKEPTTETRVVLQLEPCAEGITSIAKEPTTETWK